MDDVKKQTQRVKLLTSRIFAGRLHRKGSVHDAIVREATVEIIYRGRVAIIPKDAVVDYKPAPRPPLLVSYRRSLGKYVGDLKRGKVGTKTERENAKLAKHLKFAAAVAASAPQQQPGGRRGQ